MELQQALQTFLPIAVAVIGVYVYLEKKIVTIETKYAEILKVLEQRVEKCEKMEDKFERKHVELHEKMDIQNDKMLTMLHQNNIVLTRLETQFKNLSDVLEKLEVRLDTKPKARA